MTNNYTIAKYARIVRHGKTWRISLEIDEHDLLTWLGNRAILNKSKRVYYLHRAVKVTAEELRGDGEAGRVK